MSCGFFPRARVFHFGPVRSVSRLASVQFVRLRYLPLHVKWKCQITRHTAHPFSKGPRDVCVCAYPCMCVCVCVSGGPALSLPAFHSVCVCVSVRGCHVGAMLNWSGATGISGISFCRILRVCAAVCACVSTYPFHLRHIRNVNSLLAAATPQLVPTSPFPACRFLF